MAATAVRELPPRTGPPRDPRRRVSEAERPPREMLYARRYLSLAAYRRELADGPEYKDLSKQDKKRRFGSTIVPIHVPLAPGETKEQYEARFRGWLALQGLKLEELARDADENLERFYWFNFANENARGAVKFVPPAGQRDLPPCGRERDADLVERKRPRSDDDASTRLKSALEAALRHGRYQTRTEDTKKARVNQTEDSVVKTTEDGTGERPQDARREDRVAIPDTGKERPIRSTSNTSSTNNNLNSYGRVAKEQVVAEPRAFKCTLLLPSRNASLQQVASAYSSCGCRQCLTRSMQHLAMAVTKAEARKCATCTSNLSRPRIVDLTAVKEQEPSTQRRETRSDKIKPVDSVEEQLVAAYDEINEQIVMNEIALHTEVTRLAANPLADIHEMTRLHDENLELQEMLGGERDARSAAAAALIVYMWRHEHADLESIVRDGAAQHVPPIQRSCHKRCAEIAASLAENRDYITKLHCQLKSLHDTVSEDSKRSAIMKQRLQEQLDKLETEIQQLHDQRRQQLRVLVQFDGELCRRLQALLARAATFK